MSEETLKWLVGSLITVAVILAGVVWWAGQSDAAIKTNANNILRLELQLERVVSTLQEVKDEVISLKSKFEYSNERFIDKIESLNRKLDDANPRSK